MKTRANERFRPAVTRAHRAPTERVFLFMSVAINIRPRMRPDERAALSTNTMTNAPRCAPACDATVLLG